VKLRELIHIFIIMTPPDRATCKSNTEEMKRQGITIIWKPCGCFSIHRFWDIQTLFIMFIASTVDLFCRKLIGIILRFAMQCSIFCEVKGML